MLYCCNTIIYKFFDRSSIILFGLRDPVTLIFLESRTFRHIIKLKSGKSCLQLQHIIQVSRELICYETQLIFTAEISQFTQGYDRRIKSGSKYQRQLHDIHLSGKKYFQRTYVIRNEKRPEDIIFEKLFSGNN